MENIIMAIVIFAIAILMTMTGRGGGNFYVLTIVLFGISIHTAATTGQFILTVSSLTATILFGKNKIIEWKLVLVIGGITALSAFFGGYFSAYISGLVLKIIFAFFLVIAGLLMLKPIKEKKNIENKKGVWKLKSGDLTYSINLKFAIPLVVLTGFGSGMVGVSGGSFLVPLMVLACDVPMNIAVGTSTTMVAATAFMGFLGHISNSHFEYNLAIILAVAAGIGGYFGSKFALKTKPKNLKKLFAYTTLAAALAVIINVILNN